MISCYNLKTKEDSYVYDISDMLTYNLGDSDYGYSCSFHLEIKKEPLEYNIILMVYDYEIHDYKKIKFDYPTPEFKSTNDIFKFFNNLINNHDKNFIRKLLLTIKESEEK